MKYSEKRRIRAAIVGDVVIITRGEMALTVPSAELSDLLAALHDLTDTIAPTAAAPAPSAPANSAPETQHASHPITPVAPAPEDLPAPAPAEPEPAVVVDSAATPAAAASAAPVAEEPQPSVAAKPGQMWAAVSEFLGTKERPQGVPTILEAVMASGYPGDAERPLRIALAHRTSSGELVKTGAGRYRLAVTPKAAAEKERPPAPPAPVPQPAAPAPKPPAPPAPAPKPPAPAPKPPAPAPKPPAPPVPAPKPPAPAPQPVARPVVTPATPERTPEPAPVEARPAAKGRPGALWHAISEYLAARPRGVKVDELITLAEERGWTTAANVEHAVHASLTRVGPSRVVVSDKGIAKLVK